MRSCETFLALKIGLMLALLFVTSGCKSVADKVDAHLTELNESTDYFRNQAILLNLLRSKQGAPLSFVNVTSVGAQYNADISYALPSYEIGPLKIQNGRPFGFSNTTFGGNFQSQTTPTFNNLVGKEFNSAVTSAIPKLQMFRLTRDGYPIELLLILGTSRIELSTARGKIVIPNQDLDKIIDCPSSAAGITQQITVAYCLQYIRSIAVGAGVDFELLSRTKKSDNSTNNKGKEEENKSVDSDLSNQDAGFCFNSPRPFDKNYYASMGLPGGPGKICGTSSKDNRGSLVTAELRSLVGVYRFLGEYLRNPDLAQYNSVKTTRGFEPLLVIVENAAGPCFVETDYLGKHFCVPEEGAGQTKQVFSILDQLQNINTDVSKLPQQQVVTLSGRLR